MAQKHERRYTIKMFPWRSGLATAGQQVSIPEDQLWEATNVTAMLDGMLGKRPGTTQWGQTLKIPNPVDDDAISSMVTFLADTSGFVDTDTSDGLIVHDTLKPGRLRSSIASDLSTDDYTLSHIVDAESVKDEWAFRFVFSGTNLPAYTADATVPNTFVFRAQGADGSGKEFAIHSGGLYYKLAADDKYQLIDDSWKAGTGAWTTIEVRCDDDGGDTTVYIDEVLVATITSALLKDASLTGETDYEFQWMVEGSGDSGTQYNTSIVTPMYNDDISVGDDPDVVPFEEDPFKNLTIDGITEYQFITRGGSNQSSVVAAAGKHIYADNGLFGVWRPLLARQNKFVSFIQYRNNLVWLDTDGSQMSAMWKWDGRKEPEHMDDAPSLQFGASHQSRIVGAGDPRHPKRVYYSGIKEPNLYFSPSEDNAETDYDALLKAGFVEVPSGKGDEVTAVWGDYYGMAIIWTKKGVWKWTGYGPTSYRVDAIAGVDSGCESHNCVTQVGNDLWFLGRQGLQSLATTDKFGDLQTQFPSAPIQDLWTQNPSTVRKITTQFLHKAQVDYNPQQGLVYMAVALSGEIQPNSIFVYNVNSKTWLGPWPINSRAMANVEIGMPRLEVMMHGAEDGIIHYTDQSKLENADGSAINMKIVTAYLNGRSLPDAGPLISLKKTWRKIRIFVLPRGEWDLIVDAQVSSEKAMPTRTISQNVHKAYTLTNDFKIDDKPDGRLKSMEEMGIIEISLALRGPELFVSINQPNAGENLVVQGLEVEFVADGHEEE